MERAVRCEIAPTVPLPTQEVEAFAASVFERFENPFIDHRLLSITLNSVSKWKARILPSFKDSLALTGRLPSCLTFSFAALIAFYRADTWDGGALLGKRGGETYPIADDREVLEFFAQNAGLENRALAQKTAGNAAFWGEDLSAIPGFVDEVARDLDSIGQAGMKQSMRLAAEE
jgi:tagaturonate reductase